MNPYSFRGWHIPTAYSDSVTCDRNYSSVYPAPWTSGYFTPASVYPFPGEDISGKPPHAGNWKLNPLSSTDGSHGSRDPNLRKPGYESPFYNSSATRTEFELTSKDDLQRSCCAVSGTCSNRQKQKCADSSWRSCDMSTFDFNISSCLSPFQGLCQRDMPQSMHLPSLSLPTTTVTLKKRRRPYSKQQIAELEREYSSSTYISKSRRWELSQIINLSERQIKIWFQNRRIKAKKTQKREVTTPYSPPPTKFVSLPHPPPFPGMMQTAIPVS
ncbi:unnamed protein product [Candidula unifasciata]|uniref:Homeobox domain-containing protein n=1 Tax=Candidula unifasciata TaxID=100452 RepID=A0A8S3Z0J8_9EUPU|nr:unnamed protein product [Candidula unifasciata]